MTPHDPRRDRAATVAEYAGLTVIVATVAIMLAVALWPRLPPGLRSEICRTVGVQDCPTAEPPGAPAEPPPSARPAGWGGA